MVSRLYTDESQLKDMKVLVHLNNDKTVSIVLRSKCRRIKIADLIVNRHGRVECMLIDNTGNEDIVEMNHNHMIKVY